MSGKGLPDAAFCPTNGGFAEGVALLFNRADVSFDDYKSDEGGKSPNISEMEKGVKLAEFALLLRKDGKPLDKIVNTESFKIDNEPVQSGILKQILSSEAETSVARAILDGKSETAVFRFGTEEYVLALNALGEKNGNLFVMCAYKISVIYGEGYGLMTSILATLAGLALAIAVLTATILISRIASDRKIYNLEMVDAMLNCATPKKFQKDLEEVLKRHKTVGFAITSLKINNYA